ncbi:MAG TPA: hypothetical protein IGS37_08820 [Synechococcales cyanobacterium M55_K2018_004]|nr:hypothetical protein [Synechococcales cyanobacterium M55_K2018_004]
MNWVLMIASLVVAFLVFTFLVKVVRAAIGTAIALALVVLVLQLVFGIGPGELWRQLGPTLLSLWDWLRGLIAGA